MEEEKNMAKLAIWATMQAKPGKETEAGSFLVEACRRITADEPGTTSFFAIDLGEGRFAIFNAMANEEAFATHVGGEIAAWTQEMNGELFTGPYEITRGEVIAFKPTGVA